MKNQEMNNQSNILATPNQPVVNQQEKNKGTMRVALAIGGLAASIAYGYKKGGYVGSAVGAILYYIVARQIIRRSIAG